MTQPLCPPINGERLSRRIEELSLLTVPGVPWTRRAFSPLFIESRAWLASQFAQAGLETCVDAAGNLVGRREGAQRHRRPIVTGSHCDTVIGGGRFDGILGVLAGIEVAQTLHEANQRLEHPLEVIDFLSEEPSDFGVSCVGSRGLCGLLDHKMLESTSSADETLAAAIGRIGGDPSRLSMPLRRPGDVAAFVELHIEQGPVLESAKLQIGIVSNIVGIRRESIQVCGQPDHAGTTPMDLRRDALVGAARLIDEVYRQASAAAGGAAYLVATVGQLSVSPNMSNAVPGVVDLTLEVRSDDPRVLERFPGQIMAATAFVFSALGLTARMNSVSKSAPTECSALVMKAIEQAASATGHSFRVMPSGAGHDAGYMSKLGPMGMIFVPCLNGRSHCAQEWCDATQLTDGAQVLGQSICQLDATLATQQ